jgi:hypothetical protein
MRVEHIKHHASSLRRFEHDAMRTAMHRLTFDDGIKPAVSKVPYTRISLIRSTSVTPRCGFVTASTTIGNKDEEPVMTIA